MTALMTGSLMTCCKAISKHVLTWACTSLQGFNWECAHRKEPAWYRVLASRAPEMKAAGITAVWLPPPSTSVSIEVCSLVCSGVRVGDTGQKIIPMC